MSNGQRTTDKLRFWLMLGVLIFVGVAVHWFEFKGEVNADRRALSEFPMQVGSWKQIGSDQRFGKEVEEVLRADDYIQRDYKNMDGKNANLYIGYYFTQKTGATYHSPQNCLPGSGWIMTEPSLIKIKTDDGKEFEANRYIIENEGRKSILIYWYQGRGRAVASEYWDKLYTVFDSATRRRSDGAMVRISMPIENTDNSEKETIEAASDLAAKIAPELPNFIPN
jgi:EpsI family protein